MKSSQIRKNWRTKSNTMVWSHYILAYNRQASIISTDGMLCFCKWFSKRGRKLGWLMENKPSKGDEGRQSVPRLFYNRNAFCRFIITISCFLIDKKDQHTIEKTRGCSISRVYGVRQQQVLQTRFRSLAVQMQLGQQTAPPSASVWKSHLADRQHGARGFPLKSGPKMMEQKLLRC